MSQKQNEKLWGRFEVAMEPDTGRAIASTGA